jgi:hypothetical protein
VPVNKTIKIEVEIELGDPEFEDGQQLPQGFSVKSVKIDGEIKVADRSAFEKMWTIYDDNVSHDISISEGSY